LVERIDCSSSGGTRKEEGNDCVKGKWLCLVIAWMILGNFNENGASWRRFMKFYHEVEGIWHALSSSEIHAYA
jgi:hypothetical protein